MPQVLGWFTFALSAVVFLGAVTVYLRGSKDKGTILTLERNNKALTERVGILEAAALVKDAADKVKDAQIEAQERKIEILAGVANSGDLIAALTEFVETLGADLTGALSVHHEQAMEQMGTLHVDLISLAQIIGKQARPA